MLIQIIILAPFVRVVVVAAQIQPPVVIVLVVILCREVCAQIMPALETVYHALVYRANALPVIMGYIWPVQLGVASYSLHVQSVRMVIPQITLARHVQLGVLTAQVQLCVAIVLVVIQNQEIYAQPQMAMVAIQIACNALV